MNLATRAYVEVVLASAKRQIEEHVLRAARDEKRIVELASLPCNNEHVTTLIKWMESEGLKVEHKKRMAAPTGLGAALADDGELVEYSKYVITF